MGSTANDPAKKIITIKNLIVLDTERFNLESIKFEIGGNNKKTTINMNTAEIYSCTIIIPKAIATKHNPSIQRNIQLNVIFTGFFWPICISQFKFFFKYTQIIRFILMYIILSCFLQSQYLI